MKEIEWNELQIVADYTKWFIEVGLMPNPRDKEEYPFGKWVQIYKRDKPRACKGTSYLCVINMVVEGLIRLEEELKEQWFDPSVFKVRIMVVNERAARILRKQEMDLAATRVMKQFAITTKPFAGHSVWRITDTQGR